MTVKTIKYITKDTMANCTYTEIPKDDWDWMLRTLIEIMGYMGELSVSKKSDVRAILRWWSTSNRNLPYNSHVRAYNSPHSFAAGMVNNIMFNGQRDYTDQQLIHLEWLINTFFDFRKAIKEDLNIELQDPNPFEKVEIRRSWWVES